MAYSSLITVARGADLLVQCCFLAAIESDVRRDFLGPLHLGAGLLALNL